MKELINSFHMLGVRPGASYDDVKAAYRKLCKKWHPDRYSQYPDIQEEATSRIKDLNRAFETLKNYHNSYGLENFRADKKTEKASEKEPGETGYQEDYFRPYSGEDYQPYRPASKRNLFEEMLVFILERSGSYSMVVFIIFIFLFNVIITHSVRDIYHPPGESNLQSDRKSTNEYKNDLNTNTPAFFTIGSPEEEVLRIQGQPRHIEGNVWWYGLSRVVFKKGEVVDIIDMTGNLRAIKPEKQNQ